MNKRIITLCGSVRFGDWFEVWACKFTRAGWIVLGPECFEHPYYHSEKGEGLKKRLDELHLKKIDLSEAIFVLNVNGYIGKSTTKEIFYAHSQGKKVFYFEEPKKKGDEKCSRCNGPLTARNIGPKRPSTGYYIKWVCLECSVEVIE